MHSLMGLESIQQAAQCIHYNTLSSLALDESYDFHENDMLGKLRIR